MGNVVRTAPRVARGTLSARIAASRGLRQGRVILWCTAWQAHTNVSWESGWSQRGRVHALGVAWKGRSLALEARSSDSASGWEGVRGTCQARLSLRPTWAGVRPSPQVERLERRARIPEGPEGHRKPRGVPFVRLRSSPRFYRAALDSVRGRGTGRAPLGAACDSRDSAGWAKRGKKDRGDREGDPAPTGVPLKASGCLRPALPCPPVESPSAPVTALPGLPAHPCCHFQRSQTTLRPPRCELGLHVAPPT